MAKKRYTSLVQNLLESELEKFSDLSLTLEERGYEIERVCEGSFVVSRGFFEGSSQNTSRDIDFMAMGLVHGDEIGGLLAINSFLSGILTGEVKYHGKFAVSLGNIAAAKENKRYLERDLNRCFRDFSGDTAEDKLARQLQPLLDRSLFTLDLHQTSYETRKDFFIFLGSPLNTSWAANLCEKTPMIVHGLDFSKDGYTTDMYSAVNGGVAITYEMGEIGVCDQQVAKSKNLLARAYQSSFEPVVPISLGETANIFDFGQRIGSGPGKKLRPGMVTLSPVHSGDVLGEDNGKSIVAEHDGYLLFPKYGELAEQSSELCLLVKVMNQYQNLDLLEPASL